MISNNDIITQVEQFEKDLIDLRRKIHTFAEVGGEEFKTKALIMEVLNKNGVPFEELEGTSIIATLDSGKPGPCIALRADMDALPMHEEPNNLKGPRVCVSENPGTCHACGHDAHTAMLLTSVNVMSALKDKLIGKVYFCFESGEECGKGCVPIMNGLAKRKVDAVWGIHVYAALESGKISVQPGPRMSGAAGVEIKVIGRGGHGSRPDLSVNPVFCAAAILTNTATAWVNQISYDNPVTLGVTTIQGGGVGNIIPDTATISGSMRYFNQAEGEKAVRVFKGVAEHTAAMNGCKVEFGPRFIAMGHPVVNDDKMAELAEKALPEVLPEGTVARCLPWYASESFSRYLDTYPGVLALLGIKNDEYGSGAAHHNGFFDVDEDVLKIGVASTLKYVAAVQQSFNA